MRIFTRPSEWDYAWLHEFPSEVSLCHHYEHARYAILRAAPDHEFVYMRDSPFAAMTHMWGPVFCLSYGLPETIKFPQMTYREARQFFTFDPETLADMIDEFSHSGASREQKLAVPEREINRQQAEEILAQFKHRLKCGAGARIRQEQTDLKCLGAAKLLDSKAALDAIAFTTEVLGRPLFKNESEWSRARQRANKTLKPYHAEVTEDQDQYQALLTIFSGVAIIGRNPLKINTKS